MRSSNILPVRYIVLALAFTLILARFSNSPSYAIEGDLFKQIKSSDEPVVVKGDKVGYIHGENKVVGEGNVSIKYGDVELTCDKITVYTDTKEAICEGNVKISQPGASMEGEKIHYNFAKKEGSAIDSKIQAHPFYGGADRLEQKGENRYEIKEGYITTCDLDKPHYRITAKEIKIFLGEKIIAKHILFYIGSVPVFYMPVYVQPLGGKYPEITVVPGRTSEWGYYVLTTWRYFFSESAKGFLRLDYRQKKGLAEGVDYKYRMKGLGNGIARFYFTHEYDDLTMDKEPRNNPDDRWRVQIRHEIPLPEDTTFTMELNKLSDENIVKDYLYEEFKETPLVDNYFMLQTSKPNYVMSILTRLRLNPFYTVVEKLPEAKLFIKNQRLWNTNFYYTSTNSAAILVKKYNEYYVNSPLKQSPEESFRFDNYFKLSYASRILNAFNLTPFAATRQTSYSKNRWKEGPQLRSVYEYGFDLSTKFYRVFDVVTDFIGLNMNKLRHVVGPSARFLHRHQPTISPSNLYSFDAIDDIDYYNGFSLSLENKLQTKRPGEEGMKVVDLARLIVTTDYTFRFKKGSLNFQGIGKFEDLLFELDFDPYPWLEIDARMRTGLERPSKQYKVMTYDMDMYLNPTADFKAGLGYRYQSDSYDRASIITGEATWKINDKWAVQVYQRYNTGDRKWEDQEYRILRDLHCWSVEFSYNIRNNVQPIWIGSPPRKEDVPNQEQTFWIVFRLKAFPELPLGLPKTTYQRPHPGMQR